MLILEVYYVDLNKNYLIIEKSYENKWKLIECSHNTYIPGPQEENKPMGAVSVFAKL